MHPLHDSTVTSPVALSATPSPWLTVDEAAVRLRISTKSIYRAVSRGQLRAARIGGRRSLRFLAEWIDQFAIATSEVQS